MLVCCSICQLNKYINCHIKISEKTIQLLHKKQGLGQYPYSSNIAFCILVGSKKEEEKKVLSHVLS